MKRAVKARSVVRLALLLLFAAPARGSFAPSAGPQGQGWMAPRTVPTRLSSHAPTPRVLRLSAVNTHQAGTDELFPVRHRKHVRKRFRRRLLGPAFTPLPRNTLQDIDTVSVLSDAAVDAPASSRDHARAPPASNDNN